MRSFFSLGSLIRTKIWAPNPGMIAPVVFWALLVTIVPVVPFLVRMSVTHYSILVEYCWAFAKYKVEYLSHSAWIIQFSLDSSQVNLNGLIKFFWLGLRLVSSRRVFLTGVILNPWVQFSGPGSRPVARVRTSCAKSLRTSPHKAHRIEPRGLKKPLWVLYWYVIQLSTLSKSRDGSISPEPTGSVKSKRPLSLRSIKAQVL